jgi:uncharacterized membrane protein
MKLWVDDVRPAPSGYIPVKSVNEAKEAIISYEQYISGVLDELDYDDLDYISCDDDGTVMIDIDHDAGDFACDGGDYIRLLDWLEETGRNYPIRIHSQNPVGVVNMRRIIQRNGWKEVF